MMDLDNTTSSIILLAVSMLHPCLQLVNYWRSMYVFRRECTDTGHPNSSINVIWSFILCTFLLCTIKWHESCHFLVMRIVLDHFTTLWKHMLNILSNIYTIPAGTSAMTGSRFFSWTECPHMLRSDHRNLTIIQEWLVTNTARACQYRWQILRIFL